MPQSPRGVAPINCTVTKLDPAPRITSASLLPASTATPTGQALGGSIASLSPPDTSRSSMDTDNPFYDTYVPRHDLRNERSFSDYDESSQQSLSAFFGDEPRGSASQPWRIPPALARKQSMQHSAPLAQSEGSPLRWSYSSRQERGLDRTESFLPTRRRLSVSSVSLDSMNAKCVTPRRASLCAAGNSGSSDSPLSNTSLRHLSSSQAARIVKCDAATVDPYVN